MQYLTAIHTDVGIRKGKNQDSLLVELASTEHGLVLLCVVCDGMGGLSQGEIASAMVVTAFSRWFQEKLPKILYQGLEEEHVREGLICFIQEQNQKIQNYGKETGIHLGTTVSALLLVNGAYYIVHVGDSRVYGLGKSMWQITKDQTYVQREVERGVLTMTEAKVHPRRNILLQCVGAKDKVFPEFYTGNYTEDMAFLICSDGFYHEMDLEEFYREMKTSALDSEEKIRKRLEDFAEKNKKKGEMDNSSAVLIYVKQEEVHA